MITRTSLADEIDELDKSIKALNESKSEAFDNYREQMLKAGVAKENIKKEIEAVKDAIKLRRAVAKDQTAVEEKDMLVDEIFVEITRKTRAPRARVENITKIDTDGTKYDAETGVILDEESAPATQGEAGARSLESVSPQAYTATTGSFDANAGGPDVNGSAERASRRNENESDQNADDDMPSVATSDVRGDDRAGMARTEAAAVTDRRDDHLNPPSDGGVIAKVNGYAGLANANGVEPSSSDSVPSFMTASGAFSQPTNEEYILSIRPHCQKPGKDNCGGHGRTHCRSCLVALANGEAAA